MKKLNRTAAIVALIVISCMIMAYIDGILKPDYAVKSAIKVAVFLVCPFIYSMFDKDMHLLKLFRWNGKGLKHSIMLGIGLYVLIVGAYLVAKGYVDFSGITVALGDGMGVTGDRFIWVAIYIALINSLLEEFFFRGFAFLTLKKLVTRKTAYIFSAGAFALYHVSMMTGWFNVWIYIAVILGLFVGGLLFNYLNEKNETIYASWIVHMSANFAINTIGFILFKIF